MVEPRDDVRQQIPSERLTRTQGCRRVARAPERTLSLADIQAAMGRIRDSIYLSPCARSEGFSQLTGNSVYLKLDNLQRTGAFKERGALNKLLTLNPDERSRGVIAASAGNHAQGVAYHAGRHKIAAHIVMPLPTPRTPDFFGQREAAYARLI